ncbi:MAG TPA: PilZ domain-containing protein [Sphingomicrobium sp.]
MSRAQPSRTQRPRELRRRVLVPARLRHGASWSDACILNISSRGLMIHSGRPLTRGTEVEIRRGDHIIIARVVWRDGGRAGLKSDDRVPVEQIVTLGQSPSLQLTAGSGERRKRPRLEEKSRVTGRSIEFAGVVVIALALASAGQSMMKSALARPLFVISGALAD